MTWSLPNDDFRSSASTGTCADADCRSLATPPEGGWESNALLDHLFAGDGVENRARKFV